MTFVGIFHPYVHNHQFRTKCVYGCAKMNIKRIAANERYAGQFAKLSPKGQLKGKYSIHQGPFDDVPMHEDRAIHDVKIVPSLVVAATLHSKFSTGHSWSVGPRWQMATKTLMATKALQPRKWGHSTKKAALLSTAVQPVVPWFSWGILRTWRRMPRCSKSTGSMRWETTSMPRTGTGQDCEGDQETTNFGSLFRVASCGPGIGFSIDRYHESWLVMDIARLWLVILMIID